MKTIEEAADNYIQSKYKEFALLDIIGEDTSIKDFRDDFKAGVKFAQRWIPIEEELPEYTDFKNHNPINVKFTTILGEERVCTATFEKVRRHLFENSPYDDAWIIYPSGGRRLTTITHWRPINLK